MAPFNSNQVKYIQAVAGRQQHTTLKAIYQNGIIKSNDWLNYHAPQTFDVSEPLLLAQFPLHTNATVWDCRGVHNNDLLEAADFENLPNDDIGFGKFLGELRALDIPCSSEMRNYQHEHGTSGGLIATEDRPDDEWISSTVRATPDGFLKSLNLKLRLTLPTNIPVASPAWSDIESILDIGSGPGVNSTVSETNYLDYWKGTLSETASRESIKGALEAWSRAHPMHTPHYEFRLIVFRNRLPTYRKNGGNNSLDAIRNGVSLLNPGYDLFMGQTGRPRGPLGYRTSPKLDKNMDPNGSPAPYYSGRRFDFTADPQVFVDGSIPQDASDAGHGDTDGSFMFPLGEDVFTHRDLMTMPLNKNDYVVMRDVRFFLGQAQGKSHFEDVFDFDFNDQINTADTDLCSSDTLSDKNYRWKCVIIGTSNGKDPVHLNYEIRGTTCVQSG